MRENRLSGSMRGCRNRLCRACALLYGLCDILVNCRALGREEMDFLIGAIEEALEAAFLAADLVEGFDVCHVGCRAGQGVLAMERLIREPLFNGCELLLGADGEEAELEFDDAAEAPHGVLDGKDQFALDVGLGLVIDAESGAERFVIGKVFIGQDDGAGVEASFEGIEFDSVFAFGGAGASGEFRVCGVCGVGGLAIGGGGCGGGHIGVFPRLQGRSRRGSR